MKSFYLTMAVIGGVVPYTFFFQHVQETGVDLGGFVSAVFANPAASGFTADLLITSLVFWVAMVHRWKSGGGPNPVMFIVLNLCIGLSCAVPAYLYVTTRREPGTSPNAGVVT